MLADNPKIKRGVLLATDLMTLSLPVTIFFRADLPYLLKIIMQGAGYSWAAIIACMVPIGLCFEPIRLGLKLLGNGFRLPRLKIFAVLCLVSAFMAIGGYINATSPIVKELEYDFTNGNKNASEYRVVAFTDLHAGKLMTPDRVGAIVNMVNALKPDAVLMVGDILDDFDAEYTGSADELSRIKAPLGKFAVLGNHEYYLGENWSKRLLQKQGITVLSDSYAVVDGSLMLVGRNDYAAPIRNGNRVNLETIIPKNNKLPVILLDHTPRELDNAQNAGVALQISGHTHNGQLFPFNYVVERLYEKKYGTYRKNETNYYISCGAGFWGPPMRTNSRPEILLMKITL
ncbi:metallophosphoesterase [Maridesulfovibrio sp. FT414]|uniref:metallophosphoesterase n=1 Tax=Maridesulfovibrio sp. FT414 TaxID=2979469 RepID=UPI003D802D2E